MRVLAEGFIFFLALEFHRSSPTSDLQGKVPYFLLYLVPEKEGHAPALLHQGMTGAVIWLLAQNISVVHAVGNNLGEGIMELGLAPESKAWT